MENQNFEEDKDENSPEMIYNAINDLKGTQSLKGKLVALELLKEEVEKIEDNEMENELLQITNVYNKQFKEIEKEMTDIQSGVKVPELSEKDIEKYGVQNQKNFQALPNYWLIAMKNMEAFDINAEDEDILSNLKDIQIEMLKDNLSYKIVFVFDKNKFFTNDKLTKTYFLDKKTKECIRTESSSVNWTKEKSKKKVASFFDIFSSKKDINELIEENNEGDVFKNDLIPFSLEFYLDLIHINI